MVNERELFADLPGFTVTMTPADKLTLIHDLVELADETDTTIIAIKQILEE